jgi:hypothetical protein
LVIGGSFPGAGRLTFWDGARADPQSQGVLISRRFLHYLDRRGVRPASTQSKPHSAAAQAPVCAIREERMLARYQQSPGIEFAPLQDEVILFHSASNKFCVLNRTSSFIWSELRQPASCEEIAQRLGASFSGVDVHEALSDVDAALNEMLALGLIVSVNNGTDTRLEA